MSSETQNRNVADRMGAVPVPSETMELVGHDKDMDAFCARYATGNLHHAWLFTGPRGIGKATFAFRLAGHILRHPEPLSAPKSYEQPGPDDVMESRVAGGGHPNLLHLARPWDEKNKKFKTEVTVDEIRRTIGFFGTTTGESGWRVCIIDSADEMNDNAANALLKILEEPPKQTIFLVLSHAQGRLLPTIRSRCLIHRLKPLTSNQVADLVQKNSQYLEKDQRPDENQIRLVASLSRGSVRRALALLSNGGVELYEKFDDICKGGKNPDWTAIHALATELAPRAKDEKFKLFLDMFFDYCSSQIRLNSNSEVGISALAHWSELWEKTQQSAVITDAYNLDRKQMILSLFERMRHAA